MKLRELDRALFEAVRKEAVLRGYLPDITSYTTAAAYEAARKALTIVVDVFGQGSSYSKGGIGINRITLIRKSYSEGSIGAFGINEYQPITIEGQNRYSKQLYAPSTYNVPFEVRCISAKTEYERILQSIVRTALRNMATIKPINDAGQEINEEIPLRFTGAVTVSMLKEAHEIINNYLIKDIWLDDFEDLDSVAELQTITFSISTI